MTVGRAVVLTGAILMLAGCTSGTTATPTSSITTASTSPSSVTPSAATPASSAAENTPEPRAFGAKYHDSQSLCAAIHAHLPKIAGFAPTDVATSGRPGAGEQNCLLSDKYGRQIEVIVTAFEDGHGGGASAATFDEMTTVSAEPVNGIGDRAAFVRMPGSELDVLSGNNYYVITVTMDAVVPGVPHPMSAEIEAAEKQVALAVV